MRREPSMHRLVRDEAERLNGRASSRVTFLDSQLPIPVIEGASGGHYPRNGVPVATQRAR